mgnify:CR=1 FL=1
MNSIKVLDVTLRDGGCVNNFNFGQTYMKRILAAQEAAHTDIIELGYLDQKNGTPSGRTQWDNTQSISRELLIQKKPDILYVAMMDYGKYSPDNLPPRQPDSIDGIRVAFHKKDMAHISNIGRSIINKGYKLFIQPMITLRYTDRELIGLIELVNKELPDTEGFYIVDSFGEMRPNDMSRILNLVDHNLNPDITLGYHSHNNLQMSYSNACAMLQFPTNRNIILDCSIMGMGKGAGNLNTELLLEHLNLYYGKHYDTRPLLEVIDKVINQLHSEYYWGYAPEYYLSSANHCTPSYASHFYNKHMLPIDQVGELLGMIAEEKKISFDKAYAEELYRKYNETISVDDSEAVSELKEALKDKEVLLIAPGKSILDYKDAILDTMRHDNIISIGLNMSKGFNPDYILATRQETLYESIEQGLHVITTSNLSKGTRGKVVILNYSNWIEIDEHATHDSASVIAINLLRTCGINTIYLAGMDGFSIDINENYADPTMRHPFNSEQVTRRNHYYKSFLSRMSNEGLNIVFLTPSKYQ